MNAIDIAIAKLQKVKVAIESIGDSMVTPTEDLKRAELRKGYGTSGLMPSYSSEAYYKYKKALSTYKALSGAYDLFVSGTLANALTAVNKDNIIRVGNSSSSPDYASDFSMFTEGISDEGESNLLTQAGLKLTSQISEILNV